MKGAPVVHKGIREEEIRAAARVEELRRRGRVDVRAALTRSLLMTGVCALVILALALASDSLSSSSPGGLPDRTPPQDPLDDLGMVRFG